MHALPIPDAEYRRLRIWQIAEEEGAIEPGTFTGQIVIDVRQDKQIGTTSNDLGSPTPPASIGPRKPIDLEGLGTFLQGRRKKDDR